MEREQPYYIYAGFIKKNKEDAFAPIPFTPRLLVQWLLSASNLPDSVYLVKQGSKVFNKVERENFGKIEEQLKDCLCFCNWENDQEGSTCLNYDPEGTLSMDFYPYSERDLFIALEIADTFNACIFKGYRVIDANYKKRFNGYKTHDAAWGSPPFGNSIEVDVSPPKSGLIRSYIELWVLCDRAHVSNWKGDRYGAEGHYSPTVDEYVRETFGAPNGEQYIYDFDAEGFSPFLFYENYEDYQYLYRPTQTSFAILHILPIGFEEDQGDFSLLEEMPTDRVVPIGSQGMLIFSPWMSGEDLLHYPPGLHRYTPYQKAHDVIVLDMPAGNYRQYHLYTLDEHGERQDVGFLMRRE